MKWYLWASVSFAFLAIIFCVVYFVWYAKRTARRVSAKLNQLYVINESTHFKQIDRVYYFSFRCETRAEFNHFDLDKYFLDTVKNRSSFFKHIIKNVEYNRKAYGVYCCKVKTITEDLSKEQIEQLRIPLSLFRYYENKLFKKKQLQPPVRDVIISCKKEYTSPAGRSHTWSTCDYKYCDLKKYYEKALNEEQQKKITSYMIARERSLMTPGLRYNILKRDGYKCQICGATASDGVKLHVDHIIPVSKGGHTVPENLRVLCENCNLGKSDKME